MSKNPCSDLVVGRNITIRNGSHATEVRTWQMIGHDGTFVRLAMLGARELQDERRRLQDYEDRLRRIESTQREVALMLADVSPADEQPKSDTN